MKPILLEKENVFKLSLFRISVVAHTRVSLNNNWQQQRYFFPDFSNGRNMIRHIFVNGV